MKSVRRWPWPNTTTADLESLLLTPYQPTLAKTSIGLSSSLNLAVTNHRKTGAPQPDVDVSWKIITIITTWYLEVPERGGASIPSGITPNEFLWNFIFADASDKPHHVVQLVLEARWRLRIQHAETSFNFYYNLRCRSATMDTPSANWQSHDNSFGELVKCSETPYCSEIWPMLEVGHSIQTPGMGCVPTTSCRVRVPRRLSAESA